MAVLLCVVEGQLAVVIVEVDAHLARDEARRQGRKGDCQGLQLSAPLQPQGQVTGICVQRLEAFPQGRLFGHSQTPVPLTHLRLPVVAPRTKALHSNGAPPAIKPLVVVGDILPVKATAHPLLVSGHEQVRVGRVQVQSHLHCRVTARRSHHSHIQIRMIINLMVTLYLQLLRSSPTLKNRGI